MSGLSSRSCVSCIVQGVAAQPFLILKCMLSSPQISNRALCTCVSAEYSQPTMLAY